MHYLEDYLELLDPLRDAMREKLTLMRENDLKMQAEFLRLEEDSSEFLNNYRRYQKHSSLSPTKSKINIHRILSPSINKELNVNEQQSQLTSEQLIAQQEKQIEYDKLVKRHEQLLKATITKMNLANESHEFVERYYKKLENDLNKFKMELEADYSGLTETLEKRFASEGFNEYDDRTGENSIFDPSLLDMEPLFNPFDDLTMSNSLIDDYTTLNYLPSQSRRLSAGLTSSNSLLNRKQYQRRFSNPSSSSRGRKRLQGTLSTTPNSKRKRSVIRNSFFNDSHHTLLPQSDSDQSSSNNISTNDYFNLNNLTSLSNIFDDEINDNFDSNVLASFNGQTTGGGEIDERRYCFCNEMSYGDMIACDNRTCRREWFHYPCVGIVTPPKGKWFCTECTQILQQQSHISTTKRVSTS